MHLQIRLEHQDGPNTILWNILHAWWCFPSLSHEIRKTIPGLPLVEPVAIHQIFCLATNRQEFHVFGVFNRKNNVGLGITFVQKAREINQLAVQFGCMVVVVQRRNPKLRNNLDDFAFRSPSALWLNRTNYFMFLWVNAAETPIHAS